MRHQPEAEHRHECNAKQDRTALRWERLAAVLTGCSGVIGPSGKPAFAPSTSLLPAAAAARLLPGLTSGVAAVQAQAFIHHSGKRWQRCQPSC